MSNTFISLKGEVRIPYRWTTGTAPGAFLEGLKKRQILGAKCPLCHRVYLPPREYCGACFTAIHDFLEVSKEGKVLAATIVSRPLAASPFPAPYVLGLVLLHGASEALIHRILTGPDRVRPGMDVRAVWKDTREGSILDLEGFAPL